MNMPVRALAAKTALIALLVAGLPHRPLASGQEPQTTIRAEVALVNLVFSAIDSKNRLVPELKAEDFES